MRVVLGVGFVPLFLFLCGGLASLYAKHDCITKYFRLMFTTPCFIMWQTNFGGSLLILFELFAFSLIVGGINYLMTGAEYFNWAVAIGGGSGAALGLAMHRVKPWFKKPETFFGNALAFSWFMLVTIGWGSLIGLFSNQLNAHVEAFMLNIATMFFIRRYFLVVLPSKVTT